MTTVLQAQMTYDTVIALQYDTSKCCSAILREASSFHLLGHSLQSGLCISNMLSVYDSAIMSKGATVLQKSRICAVSLTRRIDVIHVTADCRGTGDALRFHSFRCHIERCTIDSCRHVKSQNILVLVKKCYLPHCELFCKFQHRSRCQLHGE